MDLDLLQQKIIVIVLNVIQNVKDVNSEVMVIVLLVKPTENKSDLHPDQLNVEIVQQVISKMQKETVLHVTLHV